MKKRRNGGDRRLLSLRGVKVNARQKMNGIDMFEALPGNIASLVFLDPQYRAIMDEMKFGNEGARQKGRARLPQMTDSDIAFFVSESARVLRPSGHLMLWMDKFSLVEGVYRRWLRRAPTLEVVDLLTWDKMRIGMGRRTRAQTEFMLVVQKMPKRAAGAWKDRGIKDCWPEHHDREVHPHCKPFLLTERLIRCVTERHDLVVDPCAGGYGVLEACERSGRIFLGCDLHA
jgi:site-specific DNA-methyltransferase (adenine-specific)